MTGKKPYISASQLGMYERCGEQYRRRYIENERIPPGVALLKGTGVHGGARVNFRQKVESHEDLKGADPLAIKDQLRHTTMQTTEKFYVNTDIEYQRA